MGKVYIEKFKIETNKKINKRICLISDIHHNIHSKKEFYDNLLLKIKETNSDYIVVAGDVLDSGKQIENAKSRKMIEEFIKGLGKITTTIVTVGNHDITYDFKKDGSNKKTLNWFKTLSKFDNVYYIYNEEIRFENIEFYHFIPRASWHRSWNKEMFYTEYNINPLKINKNNSYKILILHSPVSITKPCNYNKLPEIMNNINLILSGHMHNGAMPRFLEFLDIKKEGIGLYSPARKIFPKYSRGMHKIKKLYIIISRGITKIGLKKILWIFNRFTAVDITLVDLK